MRVCYFGTYRGDYSRNQIMIEGLRRNGVEVIECHEPLWRGIRDRVRAASGGWLRFAFLIRVIRTYWRLMLAHREIDEYDVMVLGYPGQLDAYLARALTWLRHKPLVLDVFMSIYLIALERGLTDEHPVTAQLIRWLENVACVLPDLLIIDTLEYVAWFQETYGLEPRRFRLVPTGADDRVFHPVDTQDRDDGKFRVLYYGTFIRNHGVMCTMEAARILENRSDVHFELIGEGPTKDQAMAFAEKHGLDNVTFVGWVDKQILPRRVAKADVCLGVFGTTPQSKMTIQNKIYQALAMKKPVITGDAPAVRRVLRHGEHLWLVKRADGEALARAVVALCQDPVLREKLARRGHDRWKAGFTVRKIGTQFHEHLAKIITR